MPCRPNDTINDLFGLYQYKMAAARTMKAKIVRAAAILYWYSPNKSLLVSLGRHGIFESEYVREGAVYSFAVRPRDNAVCAFRSLFARLPSKPKKFGELFRMFQLDEHSPREAVRCLSILTSETIEGLCHRAKGPPGGAFGLRWSLPVRRA